MSSRRQASTAARFVPMHDGALAIDTIGIGPPVLLSHGWTLDRRIWKPQIVALADRYRLISYDRRGFGQSTAPPDMASEPEDIIAIADALGINKFALVGMSQGGRVALAAAARYPSRVQALVLQGAPLSDIAMDEAQDEQVPLVAMTALARSGRLKGMQALWRQHSLMHTSNAAGCALLDQICADYAGRDLVAEAGELIVTRADAARVIAPTLIITGQNEPAWRQLVASALEGAIPDALHLTLPDAGHLGNLCQPDVYTAALKTFLERAIPQSREETA